MHIKPIDRLMFAQGGRCFFCKQPLPKSEASVEHLVASANGGSKSDDNCVAVCKTVNALLGSKSLKDKIQVILNQKGEFRCPNGVGNTPKPAKKTKAPTKAAVKAPPNHGNALKPKEDRVALVLTNLKKMGKARPRKHKTLTSTVASLFRGISPSELDDLLKKIQATGKVVVSEGKVTYTF